jgi:hypothetical protein
MITTIAATLVAAALGSGEPLVAAAAYDAKVPTLKQVVGHDVGEEISTPEEIAAYMRALAAAAPDRAVLVEQGRTWEGRPLQTLVIGAPERIRGLDAVKAGLKRLADPRGLGDAEKERLVRELPVATWLLHSVHGNEISPAGAAMAEAHHLLAARGDADVDLILRESLVLIDPLQNPDGQARFVLHTRGGRAAEADPDRAAIEHDEPWPSGRSNHYLFDMNRDWFAQTQLETQARVRLFLDFYPHVVVDLHEMGGDSTYFFAPPAEPLNPHISQAQRRWFEAFGKENAAAFDARGFAYFIRETFDSFYPGYGESWPLFQGAVGMTYEQASARGLVFRRSDESLLTYRQGILQHLTAALTTARTAAANRERILRDFVEFRRLAVEEGSAREYLIPPGGDPARAERLARLLASQGLEVRRADEPIRVAGRTLPAGTWVVPLAQPGSRLARNLLDPNIAMGDAFVKEQDRRRRKRLDSQIYDVTAWSLSQLHDVEVVVSERTASTKTSPLPAPPGSAPELREARVGYLMPWGVGTAAAVVEAQRAGLKVRAVAHPFVLGGRKFPIGTALVRASDNPSGARATLGAIAARHGAEAVAVDSGWVEEGASLGSEHVRFLRPARVVLAWDAPASSQSAGAARYVLERRYGQPVTAVRTSSLRRVDWQRFDVLVLPSGSYSDAIRGDTLARIKDWIRQGGTLVTLGDASRWAVRSSVGLLDTTTELRDGRPETDAKDEDEEKDEKGEKKAPPRDPKEPFDFEKAIQPERDRPEEVPGSLLRVELDPEHWLSAGSDGEIQAVVVGQRVFSPIKLDKGRNVGIYAAREKLVSSGLVWDESAQLLARKAYLIEQPFGRGKVVAFAEDPNFRAFSEATQLLFINAVLFGPAS